MTFTLTRAEFEALEQSLTATITRRQGLAALDSESDVEKRVTEMLDQFIEGVQQ
jgi:hypothetical protein